jgi:ribosomal protein S18 acetylase RimI-like enzyme
LTIRPIRPEDEAAVWEVIEPTIRAGETYALPRDMREADAIAYWTGADRETFVAEDGGVLLGTYFLKANHLGGGAHVANCGYITAVAATGRGVARAMCAHSRAHARSRGFKAMQFNLVVSTNTRAVRLWESLGFEIVGRLPQAFLHPQGGYVDALVMFQAL